VRSKQSATSSWVSLELIILIKLSKKYCGGKIIKCFIHFNRGTSSPVYKIVCDVYSKFGLLVSTKTKLKQGKAALVLVTLNVLVLIE
jgi:hypothetical protein